jgi:hypothetical protein
MWLSIFLLPVTSYPNGAGTGALHVRVLSDIHLLIFIGTHPREGGDIGYGVFIAR